MRAFETDPIRVEVQRQFTRLEFALTRGPAEQWLQIGLITGTERDGAGEPFLAIDLIAPVDMTTDEEALSAAQYFELAPGGFYVKRLPDQDVNEIYALGKDGCFRAVRPEELQTLMQAGSEPETEEGAVEPAGEAPAVEPVDPNQKLIAEMLKHTMNLIPALCGEQGLEVTHIQNLDRHAVMINGDRDECVETLGALLEIYNRIVRMREGGFDDDQG